ncbi:hypothetical protein ACQEU3_41440 [Spirillospora sp. CA-253888]
MLMNNWSDLIRLMPEERDRFPAVMADVHTRLFAKSYAFLADWPADRAPDPAGRDFEAITVLRPGALEDCGLTCNLHDRPPFVMHEERFIRQWAETLLLTLGAGHRRNETTTNLISNTPFAAPARRPRCSI